MRLKPGVILSPGFSDSATTARVICYVRRDTSFREKRQKRDREKKRERERERERERQRGRARERERDIPSSRCVKNRALL
jgi:hypothetical protein